MSTKNKTIIVSGSHNHQRKFEDEREKMDNLMHIKQIYAENKLPNSSQIVVAEHLSQVKAPTQAEMSKPTIKRNSALSFTSDQQRKKERDLAKLGSTMRLLKAKEEFKAAKLASQKIIQDSSPVSIRRHLNPKVNIKSKPKLEPKTL